MNLHPGVHPLPNAIAQVRRVSQPLPEGSQCTENKARTIDAEVKAPVKDCEQSLHTYRVVIVRVTTCG